MKAARYMDEHEMIEKGVEALHKALGPVETSRFLHITRRRREESVKRHRRWQKGLDKKTFFAEVFGNK